MSARFFRGTLYLDANLACRSQTHIHMYVDGFAGSLARYGLAFLVWNKHREAKVMLVFRGRVLPTVKCS